MPGLPDAAFVHDGNITKREVRALTLAGLAPVPGGLLWDVGCGCGSIAVEWLRAADRTRAVGIEPRADRRAMAAANASALGTPDLALIDGRAPEALDGLDPPDAVFIGGGLSHAVVDRCMAVLRPFGRIVANAVTLGSEAVLLEAHARHGGELVRLAVARAEATAWATGRAGEFPPGARPSPWFRAWEELQSGRPDMARRLLLADLADPSPSNWWPPDAAPVGALRDLAELLPAEMTAARSFSAYALGEVLLRTGDTHRAGTFAATAYGQHRTPLLALQVARAAAALGDQPTSMAWLRTAARGADPVALRQAVDRAPEFEWLRHDPALADALTG